MALPAGLAAEVAVLVADADEVLKAVESLENLPGVDKIGKYVNDADKVLNVISAFLADV